MEHCDNNPPPGIIVLGMHRSGTSLVANILHLWGAYVGDESELLGANRWNEAGHWEYRPLVEFNQSLLAAVKCGPFLPPADEDHAKLADLSGDAAARGHASTLIAGMSARGTAWAWKDPRLCLLLDFWSVCWTDVCFVVVVRDPVQAALSLSRRDGIPPSAALLVWQRYMLAVLTALPTLRRPARFVQYEDLISHPVDACGGLGRFLEQFCGGTISAAASIAPAMAQAVRPELNHVGSVRGSSDAPPRLDRSQQLLYEALLLSAATQQTHVPAGREYDMYPGWREYLRCWQTIKPYRRDGQPPTPDRYSTANYAKHPVAV